MWSTSEYLKPSALTRYWPTTRSILFAVTLVTIVVIHQTDGCQYSKFSPQHTMCFYKSPGCPLKQKGLSKDEITFILDEHNRYRQKVANGQVKQVNQPPAADMRQMVRSKAIHFFSWEPFLLLLRKIWSVLAGATSLAISTGELSGGVQFIYNKLNITDNEVLTAS